jgi:hypothetical protein
MLVEAAPSNPLRPCAPPPLPEESVLDQSLPGSSLWQAAGALGRLATV